MSRTTIATSGDTEEIRRLFVQRLTEALRDPSCKSQIIAVAQRFLEGQPTRLPSGLDEIVRGEKELPFKAGKPMPEFAPPKSR